MIIKLLILPLIILTLQFDKHKPSETCIVYTTCKAVLESIDRTHPYESSFLFCSPHKGVKKPVKRYSFPTQCLFISITVIAKDSCNETHSLNHSKPRANKSPDSY